MRVTRETAPPLACLLLAVPLGVGLLSSDVELGRLGPALLAGLGLVVALLVLGRLVSSVAFGAHRVVVRTEAHNDQVDAWGHELAHRELGRSAGGRVRSMVVHPDGSGLIEMRFRRPPTAAQLVAYSAAGEVYEGHGRTSSADRAITRSVLRTVPRAQRGAVEREGWRLARTGVASSRGRIEREARRRAGAS